jgi:hypothetical protein
MGAARKGRVTTGVQLHHRLSLSAPSSQAPPACLSVPPMASLRSRGQWPVPAATTAALTGRFMAGVHPHHRLSSSASPRVPTWPIEHVPRTLSRLQVATCLFHNLRTTASLSPRRSNTSQGLRRSMTQLCPTLDTSVRRYSEAFMSILTTTLFALLSANSAATLAPAGAKLAMPPTRTRVMASPMRPAPR